MQVSILINEQIYLKLSVLKEFYMLVELNMKDGFYKTDESDFCRNLCWKI
jgi:hypothetical protein